MYTKHGVVLPACLLHTIYLRSKFDDFEEPEPDYDGNDPEGNGGSMSMTSRQARRLQEFNPDEIVSTIRHKVNHILSYTLL